MTQRVVNYTYGTGNPVLPDGSIDVRDGIDNLQSFDVFMNADEDTYNQRDGGIVKTASGAIKSTGFKPGAGDFATGFMVMPGERNLAWYDPVSLNWYSYLGVIPTSGHPVAPGTNPVGDANWAPRTDDLLRSELISPIGLSLIGECPDVQTMRGITGIAGQKLILSSYNSGWAASATPPVGGGKFRWVEDNALVDDGVFIFKPSGSTGAWVRQYQKKVTPYLAGAKGDNVDDTAAMLRCFSMAKARRLNVHFDKGQYKYTQTPEVGPECSVTGEFSVAELLPVGCDGFKFTSSDAVGGRKFGGFVLFGAGANDGGYAAIKVDPGQDASKRTTGVSFEDIQVFNFKTAVDAKNLWHSTFRSVNATNVCNGIVFRGRCVSNEVGSGTKLVRGDGALVSGECIGVQFIESSDYTPSVAARPEGCTVTPSVLVFGFDVLVDVDSMLAGGIYGADLDYGRSRGVRYRNWDGNPTIAPNWIAGDAGFPGQPFIGVEARPVGTQRTTGPSIDHITMNTFNGNPGDCGVRIGSLNGRARISKCLISNQSGAGVYLDGGRFNTIFDCQIDAPDPLFMFTSGGNQMAGNTLSGGPISNISPTAKNLWGKNQGEFCTEDTVEVPIAAGQLSGALNLASIGYSRGVPLAAGLVSLTCSSTGTTDPGSLYASISPDGMTITAYKTIPSGVPSSLFVRIQLAS